MKDFKVDGVDWDDLDSSTKTRAIVIIAGLILIPLIIFAILIFNTSLSNKLISIIVGLLLLSGIRVTKTDNKK